MVAELIRMVRERIGPVASFKLAMVVRQLPKTRSGKIVRGTIKKIAAVELVRESSMTLSQLAAVSRTERSSCGCLLHYITAG